MVSPFSATRASQNAQLVHRQCTQSTFANVHSLHRFFVGGISSVVRAVRAPCFPA